MATIDKSTAKDYFKTGDKPTAGQFANLIDSMAFEAGLRASFNEAVAASNLVCYGDSLTRAYGGVSYAIQLCESTGYTLTNMAIDGQTSTQQKTIFDTRADLYANAHIFWVGRNDISVYGPSGAATIKSNLAAMIASLGHTNYLVIGVINKATEPTGHANLTAINTLNGELTALYGARFIDIRAYLLTQGTVGGQDAIDVGNGVIPVSLRTDETHLNTLGQTKVAQKVALSINYLKGIEQLSKLVTIESLSTANGLKKKDSDLGDKGSYRIAGIPVAYLPNQELFKGTVIFGDGGKKLIHTAGSEGFYNTGIGLSTLLNLEKGSNNIGIGTAALNLLKDGNNNIGIGLSAGGEMVNTLGNTAIGSSSSAKLVNGDFNTSIGYNSRIDSTGGGSNTTIGAFSGSKINGFNNVVVGFNALSGGTSLYWNTAIGYQAGDNLANGNQNVIVGYDIDFPNANGSNQLVIANIIFGQGCNGTGTTKAGTLGIGVGASATAMLSLPASIAGIASLNIAHGVAPAAPINGDIWTTSAGMFTRINGVTKTVTLT